MAREDSGFGEIEEYTKKLTQNPESLVFVPLAEAYRKSGMLDEAIAACLKGLQVHPSYMSARMVLGRAYMEKEMFEEAATEFRKVAAADVNNIMAHSLLGQIYMKQGKFTNAIEEYQKVLSINPEDSNAQQMLTQALEQTRQTGGPAKSENAGTAEQKKEISQAEALTKQGDIDNAIKIYQLILEADPENLVVRQRLRDLELRKVQASTGRKSPDRAKPEAGGHRDNDKITSDDILSVMKDTVPRGPGQAKAGGKAEAKAEGKAEGKAEAKAEGKAEAKAEGKADKAEAKAEPKAQTAPAAAGKAAELTPEIIAALTKLPQTPGIVGSLLVGEQGQLLHSTFGSQAHNLADMAQTAALIFEKTGKAVAAMQYGKQIKQILITGEKGQIFFNKFGERILLVQAEEHINIGKMRLALNEINKVLK